MRKVQEPTVRKTLTVASNSPPSAKGEAIINKTALSFWERVDRCRRFHQPERDG